MALIQREQAVSERDGAEGLRNVVSRGGYQVGSFCPQVSAAAPWHPGQLCAVLWYELSVYWCSSYPDKAPAVHFPNVWGASRDSKYMW